MQTIELSPGTTIENAARQLVGGAPARADFNGIRIRARYATTNPRDIVAQYHRDSEFRGIVWRNSPEGRRVAAETEARTSALQVRADRLIALLPSLDMSDPAAVLAWVADMADPGRDLGVDYDHKAVVWHFAAHGWGVGVNCGQDFRADDARNFAGWIVGQWLHRRYPGVARFVDDWRKKFVTA